MTRIGWIRIERAVQCSIELWIWFRGAKATGFNHSAGEYMNSDAKS